MIQVQCFLAGAQGEMWLNSLPERAVPWECEQSGALYTLSVQSSRFIDYSKIIRLRRCDVYNCSCVVFWQLGSVNIRIRTVQKTLYYFDLVFKFIINQKERILSIDKSLWYIYELYMFHKPNLPGTFQRI